VSGGVADVAAAADVGACAATGACLDAFLGTTVQSSVSIASVAVALTLAVEETDVIKFGRWWQSNSFFWTKKSSLSFHIWYLSTFFTGDFTSRSRECRVFHAELGSDHLSSLGCQW